MNKLPGKKQQGAVLLIMMVSLIIAVSVYFLSGVSLNEQAANQQKKTRVALAKAKQALIDYAASYYERQSAGDYGVLPCPELSGSISNGRQQTPNCGSQNVNVIGRLPWYTLGLPPLQDASGECLWYAVSGGYKFGTSAKTPMLNDDTPGMFQLVDENSNLIAGALPEDRPVALVIAPGPPLANQTRPAADNNVFCHVDRATVDINQYLDTFSGVDNTAVASTVDTIDSFMTSAVRQGGNINDQIIAIYPADIFNAIRRNQSYGQRMADLTQIAAQCIGAYGKMQACQAGRACIANCNSAYNICISNAAGNTADEQQCHIDRAVCLNTSNCDSQCNFNAGGNSNGNGLRNRNRNRNRNCNVNGNRNGIRNRNGNGNGNRNGNGNGNCNGSIVIDQMNLPRPAVMNLEGADYRLSASYQDISSSQENDIDKGLLGRYMFDVSNGVNDAAVNNIFEACGEMNLNSIASTPINMVDPTNAYRKLWENWKDHLFYVVGRDMTSTHSNQVNCAADCPTDASGQKQAAMVWFSMERNNNQRRLSVPPESSVVITNDKSQLDNYLELVNSPLFPDAAGNKTYQKAASSNDIAYCIDDDMSVSLCP